MMNEIKNELKMVSDLVGDRSKRNRMELDATKTYHVRYHMRFPNLPIEFSEY